MDLDTLKSIIEHSNKVDDLAFKLLVASFAVILTTSYIKPVTRSWKLIYLIFIPGWILLYLSINSCDDLNRRTISYKITLNEIETFRKQNKIDIQVINNQNVFLNQKIDILNKISEKINTDFTNQLDYFKYSLIVFGIWLLSYLIWFIRTDKLIEK